MTRPPLTLLVCGAPLAARAEAVRDALDAAGWSVAAVVTDAARQWTDLPSEPRHARPAAVVACPLTFHTANRAAAGIMDTPATAVLCDGLGAGVRTVAVPMVNDRLWGHPVWAGTLALLAGARLLSPLDGRTPARAVASGTGEAIAAAFRPSWVVAAVGPAHPCGSHDRPG